MHIIGLIPRWQVALTCLTAPNGEERQTATTEKAFSACRGRWPVRSAGDQKIEPGSPMTAGLGNLAILLPFQRID
jgi:hypothetical protein